MIAVEKISLAYGKTGALHDVSLAIHPGEILGLVGPSGSGKSSLLRVIAGLEVPMKGTVSIQGTLASTPSQRIPPCRRNLAMIFQDLALWPHMTAEAHLRFVLASRKRRKGSPAIAAREILSAVGLPDHARRYPHQLSGGEQQRLAIARALAQNPAFLLMDEPFSSLDPVIKTELEETIAGLKQQSNIGILYVTHQMADMVRIADRIAVMEKGRIVQVDEKPAILEKPQGGFAKQALSRMGVPS